MERKLVLRGRFRLDIEELGPGLKPFRSAILHVPSKNRYLDNRIAALMAVADSPITIRRIHRGFGRLFIEEHMRRKSAEAKSS